MRQGHGASYLDLWVKSNYNNDGSHDKDHDLNHDRNYDELGADRQAMGLAGPAM